MSVRSRFVHRAAVLVLPLFLLSGCQTLQEIAQLRNVNFHIDRLADVQLAGVEMERIRNYNDLGAMDVLRLGQAVLNKELPLSFTLHLTAENPPDNRVNARLTQLDWTLLLEDRETISGNFGQTVVLEPGQPTDIPFTINLNLVEFFDKNAKDLFDLASSLAGQGGAAKNVKLQALPTVETALGPIRYPNAITIFSRDVGGE